MKIAEDTDIRWMIGSDSTEIIRINQQSPLLALSEPELTEWRRKRNSIGIVSLDRHRITGFMLYELNRERIHIERMAVATQDRRCGIGSALVDRIVSKLHNQRRKMISIRCSLDNIPGLRFLRRNGFIATSMQGDSVELVYSIDPDLTVWKDDGSHSK